MKIAIVADPYIPVPPELYGGIERIIGFLVAGLHERGHHVTLIAHPESTAPCAELVPYGRAPHQGVRARATELAQVQQALWTRVRRLDVVHSFGRLAGLLPLLPMRWLPKIQSYQRAVSWPGVQRAALLGGSSLAFTACSTAVYSRRPASARRRGAWSTIFNGVDVAKYQGTTQLAADAPLMFLGQLHPMKGPQVAIAIARATGRRLLIAGSLEPGAKGQAFFDRVIAPSLGDGIDYVGPVDDRRKNELLGRSAALVFPSFYDEAFGIVMAEAMACGTPVIAYANGSVPEVVAHGRTGFVCHNEREAIAAVRRIGSIDRAAVRRECEARFSASVIVDEYERLYAAALARVSPRKDATGLCAAS